MSKRHHVMTCMQQAQISFFGPFDPRAWNGIQQYMA
jgi:hypothetical protein